MRATEMEGLLVGVAWLAAHAEDPSLRIVDCRWYLTGKRGADAYAAGHIPGAVFLDLDQDLAAPRGAGPGRHPLPRAEAFAVTLARAGIGPSTIVVAYDDAGGAVAARVWWLLRFFGHEGGRVLDGGLPAWVAAGHAISTEVPHIEAAAPMTLTGGHAGVVDKLWVDRARSEGAAVLLDARARDRYEGKSEPVDARPGHIPGARSAPFVDNLVAPAGVFQSASDLRARYEKLGAIDAAKVVAYCGSGVTACHDLLALTLAGRDDALLYEGSWSDWAGDPTLPATLGPDEADVSTNSQDRGDQKG